MAEEEQEKTSLISEFIKDKKAIYYLATEESEYINLENFASLASEFTSNPLLINADKWDIILKHISEFKTDKKIIVIDEFQYLGKSNPAFVSKLKKYGTQF